MNKIILVFLLLGFLVGACNKEKSVEQAENNSQGTSYTSFAIKRGEDEAF